MGFLFLLAFWGWHQAPRLVGIAVLLYLIWRWRMHELRLIPGDMLSTAVAFCALIVFGLWGYAVMYIGLRLILGLRRLLAREAAQRSESLARVSARRV